MDVQADVSLKKALRPSKQVELSWKLCDNGYPVDEGTVRVLISTAQIDWMGHEPPLENVGLLTALIQQRVRDYLAGL